MIEEPDPNELKCERDSDCAGDLVCGTDGNCRAQCAANKDCLADQVCSLGVCAEMAELDESGRLPVSQPELASCTYNSECDAGQFCPRGRCIVQCLSNRDCAVGSNCVDGQCVTPGSGPACVLNSDCPMGQVCHPSGQCVPECVDSRDCVFGQVCQNARCIVEGSMTGDGGMNPSSRCSLNSDCAQYQRCSPQGFCVAECYENRDCATGQVCEPNMPGDGGRVPGHCTGARSGEQGAPCSLNSDCNAPLRCTQSRCAVDCNLDYDCPGMGACCVSHLCYGFIACLNRGPDGGFVDGGRPNPFDAGACSKDLDCDDGVFCNGNETCLAGSCRTAPKMACDDNNPCSTDSCNEANKSCAYASVLTDSDNDGHFPIACGGTNSDDCDDTDPFTYGGLTAAPERCDFRDNNCNGTIDEGLWLEKQGARVAITTGSMYPNNAGPPVLLRYGSSIYIAAASDGTTRGSIDVFRLDGTSLTSLTGPVAAVASTTPWVSAPNIPSAGDTFYGKRAYHATMAMSDAGQLVVSAVTSNFTTQTCGNHRFAGVYGILSPDLLSVDGGQLGESTQLGCNVANGPQTDQPVATWVPQTGKWAFVIPRTEGGAQLTLEVTQLDAAGNFTTSRKLIEASPSGPAAQISAAGNFYQRSVTRMATGPNGVMVAWMQYTAGGGDQARYAIFSHDFTSVVFGPVTLATTFGSTFKDLRFDGTNYVAVVGPAGVNRADTVFHFTPGGAVLPDKLLLSTSAFPGFASSLPSGFESRIAYSPSGLGLFSATTGTNGLIFGWGLASPGTSQLVVNVNIGAPTTHTDFALTPLDEKHVAVFWADGDLKRTIMECAP